MPMFTCSPCRLSDPTTDTVKVSIPEALPEAAEASQREQAELEKQRLEEEEARRMAAAREEEARAEARRRAAEEEAARRRAEEQRRREQEELERARLEADLQRQREEAERLRQEEEAERAAQNQAVVQAFLKDKGFKAVAAPKKWLLSTTYALHCAAERGDEHLVELLLQEGADPTQKNSAGKTAAEVAQKKSKKGSHDSVVRRLGGA